MFGSIGTKAKQFMKTSKPISFLFRNDDESIVRGN